MSNPVKKALRWLLVAAYVALLIIPGWVFFAVRGGSQFFSSLTIDLKTTTALLFPLAGLYAFSLLSIQMLIGSNMRRLRPLFPKLIKFHRYQGLVVFGLVLLHPSMVLGAYGLISYIKRDFVPQNLAIWIIPAWLAIAIIPVTVITAVIAWKAQRLTRIWRWVHLANYAAFVLVWIHSWFLGSDVQSTQLKYIWMLYGLAAVASIGLRIRRALISQTSKTLPPVIGDMSKKTGDSGG